MPQLPVAVIIEPLIKQWSLYGYMNTDFDFMVALARHLRLGLQHALRLLDLCARICVNDPLYGRAASVPMLVLLNRFYNERSVQLYVQRAAGTRDTPFRRSSIVP